MRRPLVGAYGQDTNLLLPNTHNLRHQYAYYEEPGKNAFIEICFHTNLSSIILAGEDNLEQLSNP